MNLSDLQRKDVIEINSGTRLGKIYDVKIDESGQIIYFVVVNRKFLQFWKSAEEKNIPMPMIKKIGIDTILVSTN